LPGRIVQDAGKALFQLSINSKVYVISGWFVVLKNRTDQYESLLFL